jgi:hypothetical protein
MNLMVALVLLLFYRLAADLAVQRSVGLLPEWRVWSRVPCSDRSPADSKNGLGGAMRPATVLMLALLLCAAPAMAQQSPNGAPYSDSHKTVKIMAGIGALAVGTAIAAKSSQSTTVSSTVGTSETSSFSSSQLIVGLAIAGGGGILIWDALRQHEPPRPSAVWGVGLSKNGGGQLFWRRIW